MSVDGPLGEAPEVAVEVDEDLGTLRTPSGFVRLTCRSLRCGLPEGGLSEPFHYDIIERRCLDAVVILLHRASARGVEVCLRSQLRVPVAFRHEHAVPTEGRESGVLWEVPAGLIEPGEVGPEGIALRASQETLEETGYDLPPERFEPFGCASYPTAGLIAEKFHFVAAELTEDDHARAPEGDGHALERSSVLRFVELSDALEAVDRGVLRDVKTEIVLRRLAARRGTAA